MSDVVTVLRKELLESMLDLHSLRGSLVQACVLVGVAGVLLPIAQPGIWANAGALMGVYFVFPSLVAASVGADSFAGERERKTLETLLATPLSDTAVFFGKTAWIICHTTAVALIMLAAGVVTTALGTHSAVHGAPLLGALGTALAAAFTTAAIAVGVSSRLPVTRSAQQLTTLLSLSLCAGVFWLVRRSSLAWPALYTCDCALIAAGATTLLLTALSFRRDRLFNHR